jgi:Secretion system C-terminal sorting domain
MNTNVAAEMPSLRLYPNPSTTKLYLFSEKKQIENLKVLDINGRIISYLELNSTPALSHLIINLENLSPGNYFCKVQFYDKSLETVRFVKQ